MPSIEGIDNGAGYGVRGSSQYNVGVHGRCTASDGLAVFGEGLETRGVGVWGHSLKHIGVVGSCHSVTGRYAGSFVGDVLIRGTLSKSGGRFKIDHPLDPANKYLSHSFVESPDMKNVYDGIVVLDDKGEAEVELPDWFSTLNTDFRYQLTPIGASGPNLYCRGNI